MVADIGYRACVGGDGILFGGGCGRMKRASKARFAAIALMAAGALALAVRFTVRDAFLLTGVVFYACPLIVTGGIFLAAAGLWVRRRSFGWAVLCVLIAIVCGGGWVKAVRCCGEGGSVCSDAVRVLVWNAGRLVEEKAGEAVECLLKHVPDVVVVVESGGLGAVLERCGRVRQGYDAAAAADEGLTVLAKGRVEELALQTVGRRGRIARCRAVLAAGAVRLIVVDMDSNPFISRRAAMEEIGRQIAAEPADIILGDFNTPADSVLFEPLRKEYVHAFEQAGNGLNVTWPCGLPIMAIDHIWVRRSLAAVSAKIITTFKSDHRMVFAEIDLGGKNAVN